MHCHLLFSTVVLWRVDVEVNSLFSFSMSDVFPPHVKPLWVNRSSRLCPSSVTVISMIRTIRSCVSDSTHRHSKMSIQCSVLFCINVPSPRGSTITPKIRRGDRGWGCIYTQCRIYQLFRTFVWQCPPCATRQSFVFMVGVKDGLIRKSMSNINHSWEPSEWSQSL